MTVGNESNEEAKEITIELLLNNADVRYWCGIKKNEDGTFWIEDLDHVRRQPEATKVILREFIKKYGRKPPQDTDMSPQTRRNLDALYARIEELKERKGPLTYFNCKITD
jgi:hypothetical protein